MTNANNEFASSPRDHRRRQFLLAAGLGMGGAAAVTLVGNSVRVDSPAVPEQPSRDRGYQATDHVRNYYRTARI